MAFFSNYRWVNIVISQISCSPSHEILIRDRKHSPEIIDLRRIPGNPCEFVIPTEDSGGQVFLMGVVWAGYAFVLTSVGEHSLGLNAGRVLARMARRVW